MAVHFVGGAVAGTTTEAMINTKNEAGDMTLLCCASCGTAGVDDVKLKKCACGLVKYCSIACQKNHRSQHKKLCKKRLAELRDKALFKQPDGSNLGGCPICCLPLSNELKKSTMMNCCCKLICNGCDYTDQKRVFKQGLYPRCPFCRDPTPRTQAEANKQLMKRAKKNDPAALFQMGANCFKEGDYDKALKYHVEAAGLNDARSHYELSRLYYEGRGIEKDTKKYIYHSEEAAIGGHPVARYNLGVHEVRNGRFERAVKHFIIAANLGYHGSLQMLKELHAKGNASKEEYADALRACQAVVDATRSTEREEAEEYSDWLSLQK
jgi:hypothetical protein